MKSTLLKLAFILGLLVICIDAHANNDDLKAKLAEEQVALKAITGSIVSASGPEFTATHNVELTLGTSLLQTWLSSFSTPTFSIKAVAISVSGDLFYDSGHYKVWIQNPNDTWANLTFEPFEIAGSNNQLVLKSSFVAHLESRVYVSASGLQTNILCLTKPDIASQAVMQFSIDSPVQLVFPYTVKLVEPSQLNGIVACLLGGLGEKDIPFPISDIARELGRGKIDLGFQSTFRISLPTEPPRTIFIPIQIKDSFLSIDSKSIKAQANVEVLPQGSR